ncbi:MAG TPA: thioredoxin family protein [Bacilli bacterium]
MKLLKFEKENCPACQMVDKFLQANNIEAVKVINPEVNPLDEPNLAVKVNPFDFPNLAAQFGIASVPVTILLDDEGNEIQRVIGFKLDELQEMISKLQ